MLVVAAGLSETWARDVSHNTVHLLNGNAPHPEFLLVTKHFDV